MTNIMTHQSKDNQPPSEWVRKHLHLVKPNSSVLDLACGTGRHTILMHNLGHKVTAVDINVHYIYRLQDPTIEVIECDLENGKKWPFSGRSFDVIITTNYLYRPILHYMLSSLAKDGILIYETFAVGNELFGKPSNPNFLLKDRELINICKSLKIISYESLIVHKPKKEKVQRIVAKNIE